MKILDFNHCNLPDCKCGWNVLLSGVDEEELQDLRMYLQGKVYKDKTDYREKINQEKF